MNVLSEINKLRVQGYFRDIEDKEDYYLCTCPFHKNGEERTPSFSINKRRTNTKRGLLEEGYTHCFGCGYKGTFSRFLADVKGVSEFEILKQFNRDKIWEDRRELTISLNREVESSKGNVVYDILSTKGRAYLESRNLKSEIIEIFNIGSDRYDNIVFPLVDKRGDIIAIQKRAISTKQFYNTEGFDKMNYVYGLYQVIQSNRQDSVFVVESIIDCLTLWGWGYLAVALMGAKYSDYHITELCKLRNDVVLALDNDEVGKTTSYGLMKCLQRHGKRVRELAWGRNKEKDINELSAEKFKQLQHV